LVGLKAESKAPVVAEKKRILAKTEQVAQVDQYVTKFSDLLKKNFEGFKRIQIEHQLAGICLLLSGALPEEKNLFTFDPKTN
jgi:hypothetical protein